MADKISWIEDLLTSVGLFQQRNRADIDHKSTDHKGRIDLVTDVDRKSERRLVEALREQFSDDSILAEEETSHEGTSDRTWIIDPLDGTTNYVHGHPFYGISLGLMDDGKLTEGYTYFPESDDFYSAQLNNGAQKNGSPIHVTDTTEPLNAMLGTGFADMRTKDNRYNGPIFLDLLEKTQGIRRAGSAVHDLCMVAEGVFEGFWEFNLNPWDVAAGAVIIREAGGSVTDTTGGENWLDGKNIVASNGDFHDQLLQWLQPHLPDDLNH